jgi:hypothetical protein
VSKIIQDPSRVINALTKSFGEHNRHAIAAMFSNYISDAVIAVTTEDIIEQVIAWANSHENFHAAWIEPEDEDRDRFNFIHEFLETKLNIPSVMSEIERKGNLSDGYSGGTIDGALKRVHGEFRLLEIVLDAANQYDLYLENNNG